MGCAPKNLTSKQDRGVWHVSIKPLTHRMKHTRVPSDGSQRYFAACYRNIVDTKPSHFLNRIRSQIESRIENRKKRNGPNRKLNCLKKKKIPHTSCHFGLLLGLIDAVQCLHKLRTLALISNTTSPRKFNGLITLFQTKWVSFVQNFVPA